MNDTYRYCKTISRVTKAELIGALHQSLIQLKAAHKEDAALEYRHLDHVPAITENVRVLRKAGYIGFTK